MNWPVGFFVGTFSAAWYGVGRIYARWHRSRSSDIGWTDDPGPRSARRTPGITGAALEREGQKVASRGWTRQPPGIPAGRQDRFVAECPVASVCTRSGAEQTMKPSIGLWTAGWCGIFYYLAVVALLWMKPPTS